MKKITNYLLVLLTVLFMGTFASCSEKEDDVTELNFEQILQYTHDIVGMWKVDGTQEYWYFDAQGGGSIGYGENWNQGNEGTYKFQWYFKPSGLYIIIRIQGEHLDTDCPYAILSLTSSKLTWKTNQGRQVSMTRHPELTNEQIAQGIVGKWKVDGEQEYWYFDTNGNGIYEVTEDVVCTFKWYFESSYLYLCIRRKVDNIEEQVYSYRILSLTSTTLSWKSYDGYQKTMTRQ